MNDIVPSKTDAPTVTWLLCTHVADEQLRMALQSCQAQTFSDFELLVVINGDSAGSVASTVRGWCAADPRVRVAQTAVRHLTFSLALGLHLARGTLIARMDGDDLARPDRLQRQVDFLRQHPDVVVVGTAYELINSSGHAMRRVELPLADRQIRRALLRGNPLCHPSVMFRRDVVLAVGGYLGGIYAQDYDLWVRLALHPVHRFANLSEVGLGYRDTGVGGARKARTAYASMAGAQFRNFALGAGWGWGWAAALTLAKALVCSTPASHA